MSMKRSSVQKVVMALAVVALLAVPMAGMVSAADQPSGITTPADGATVSGVVEAAGYADTAKFSKWVLELLPAGNEANHIYLTSGITPGAWTYKLDTTVFPAGEHALRLRVVKADGNYDEYVNNFTIAAVAPSGLGKLAAAVTAAAPQVQATTAAVASQAQGAVKAAVNGITLPASLVAVSDTITLKGYAADAKFDRWQLDLLPGGDAAKAILLKVGTTAGDFNYDFNVKGLPVGEHLLRLRVVRPDGNYVETLTKLAVDAKGVLSTSQLTDMVWQWEQTQYSDGKLIAAADPTRYLIEFLPGGRAAIKADCNRVSATYKVTGNNLNIVLGPSTLVACPPDSQAQEYLKGLANVGSYMFNDGKLVLMLKLDSGSMIFSGSSPTALAGTAWEATGINNGKQAVVSVVNGTKVTLNFGADGAVSGSAGCNTYNGSYETTGNQIKVGPLASTRKMCVEPEGIMEQEASFLAALQAGTTFKIEGNQLTTRDASGAMQITASR